MRGTVHCTGRQPRRADAPAPPGALREGELDAQGWRVEEFGLPLDLMLAVPCRVVVGGARAALAALAAPRA